MDVSTTFRFHAFELIPSVVWRCLQIRILGISPPILNSWQSFLFGCIVFHHSNLRLPIGLERLINGVIVTPRMHGIHHSIVPKEQNSNWSSGLTIWDKIHGTLKLNVPQDEIVVGVPAFLGEERTTLQATLTTPLVENDDDWKLPDNGVPQRRNLVMNQPDTILIS
jgi:sterol desaturase/sphingolipid hydroxylase (fatty acid hydroxylase superfamily)